MGTSVLWTLPVENLDEGVFLMRTIDEKEDLSVVAHIYFESDLYFLF